MIELSLWPAGINTSAPGTVEWAGGMIDWNDPDYVAAGHFYALVSSVSIECLDPTTPAADVTSYIYGTNSSQFTPSVSFSNESTISGAFGAIDFIANAKLTFLVAVAVAMVGAGLV